MLLHCLLIHLKQFVRSLYRDGSDMRMINLQVFCLLVLHLRTHLSSGRHPGTPHQLL